MSKEATRDATPNHVEGEPKPSPLNPSKQANKPRRTDGENLAEAFTLRSATLTNNTSVKQMLKPETIGPIIANASYGPG